jgi:hypothetical protein
MAQDDTAPLRIDWASAEVRERALKVALAGEAPKELRKRVDGLLALIEPKGGEWGKVEVRRDSIAVGEVQPGAEADLRHLLESVVMQINSDVGRGLDAEQDGGGSEGTGEDPQQSADREMGERFRGFADRQE